VSVASTPPQAYTVTLGASATDAGGTAMGVPYTSSFKTLRRITQTMLPEEVVMADTYQSSLLFCTGDKEFTVGPWDAAPYAGGTDYIFVHYSFTSLGTLKSGTNFESAIFNAKQTSPSTGIYPTGSVLLDRFDYHVLDASIFGVNPRNTHTLCSSDILQPSDDVLTLFRFDFESGAQELLYRLSSSILTVPKNDEYWAYFACDGFNLVVTFTTP
jgi:hypothetical protein